MEPIFSKLPRIANSDSTVLITGETGTGKEVLARAIHSASSRRDMPFIAINCGAFPETLLESELFGFKKGAFTGALFDKPGRFALANGGTLFLDEIGEISTAMQVRLLRVLQERRYEPLGSIAQEETNIRIIAATHRDLSQRVEDGMFRLDFFYRINVIHLNLPPLRERRQDIPFLAEVFLRRFAAHSGGLVPALSDEALEILKNYAWPGNVRELENVIERSLVFCNGNLIEPEDFSDELQQGSEKNAESSFDDASPMTNAIRHSEIVTIQNALKKCGGNRRKAAELLGIHPSSLYRKMNLYLLSGKNK